MLEKKIIQRQNIVCLLSIIISYILLVQNRLWQSFVDEADNFVGGWLISKGWGLYKDVFSHHMPFPYYYSSLLIKLGLNDVNGLRIGMSLTILFFWMLIIILFKEKINYKILCILIFLSAIAHPIFWGHMFLADTFFAYSILIIFLYFFSNPQLNFDIKDKIVIALMIYVSMLSTLVSIFPIILVGIYYILKKATHVNKITIETEPFEEIKFVMIIIIPFILSLIYFYLTNSLREFYNQAYLFNKIYYSQFTENVIKLQIFDLIKAYSEHIFFYISNYKWLIDKNYWVVPPWNNPLMFFEGFLVISNLAVLILFWKKKSPYFIIFFFIFLAFLRTQGEQFYGSGWFHGSPYYLISFFNIGFIITESYELLTCKFRKTIQRTTKDKINIFLIVLYSFFAILLIGVLSYAYISNGSGINSKDAYASPYDKIIQTLTKPDDTIWVAPLDPSLYFTNNRLPASRYTFYLPWSAASNNINEELIEDLKVKQPPLIIYNREADIWGEIVKDYGKTIDEYILQNYYQVNTDDPIYKNIYLINSRKYQLLKTLIESGLYPN